MTWINIVAVKPIYALQMTVREPTLLGAKLAASFLCAAPILLHVSPAKTVPPLAEPAITSNTALSLLLGGGDGDAQLPRAKHDLTHMKDNAATSKPTIVVIDGGPAIRDLIEFLLRPWDIM